MQHTTPVAAIVSANELFTPALVSLESCLLVRLTVCRTAMREEAVNDCVHFCATVEGLFNCSSVQMHIQSFFLYVGINIHMYYLCIIIH